MSSNRSWLEALFFLVCGLILYGSLFPFDFVWSVDKQAWEAFWDSWKIATSRGDILGNIVLFVPFGVAAFLRDRGDNRHSPRISHIILAWVLVALVSQLAQLFLESRDPSIFDIYCNAVGASAGWYFARYIPNAVFTSFDGSIRSKPIPLFIASLWLLSLLLPLIPSIDLQSYKNALKPLFLNPEWSAAQILFQTVCWITFFHLLIIGSSFLPGLKQLLAIMCGVLVLRVIIVQNQLALSDVIAAFIALACLLMPKVRSISRMDILAWLLMATYLINAIFPIEPREEATSFGWLPLSGFLQGSMLANSISLCLKGFVFGSALYLYRQQHQSITRFVVIAASTLTVLEIYQVWFSSDTPEITDPIMFLAIAWVVLASGHGGVENARNFSNHSRRPGGLEETQGSDSSGAIAAAAYLLRPYLEKSLSSPLEKPFTRERFPGKYQTKVLVRVLVYCVLAVSALGIILNIDGIPYNILELFRYRGAGPDLLFFSLAMLSVGWGSAWLGEKFRTTTRPLLEIPFSIIKVTFVIYVFLWLGVTRESINDIVGSNVFFRRVTEREVFGPYAADLFKAIGPENVRVVTDLFEPIIRFTALMAPLLAFSGFWFAVIPTEGRKFKISSRFSNNNLSSLFVLIVFLWLSKVIAFDWAATDNLYELIAREGSWGIGGGGYLYGLIVLIAFQVALVTRAYVTSLKHFLVASAATLVTIPISWFLLNNGLEDNIVKYGYVFSGVDFLLGPDRKNLISSSELFLRWSFVYVLIIFGMAFGALMSVYWRMKPEDMTGSNQSQSAQLEFRVHSSQWDFLSALQKRSGSTVDSLVPSIIRYMGDEIEGAPKNRALIAGYIDSPPSSNNLAPMQVISPKEMPEDCVNTILSVDPAKRHGHSRVFRKFLEIFITISEDQAAEKQK